MAALRDLMAFAYEMFRPPKKQTVSEWADENRVLVSDSSAEPGPWRTDRAPYQREIMDAFTQPGVYEIVVMASAQCGKSEIELNMMGRAIDIDPGPILYVQPTDKVAEDYSKRRIAPMIAACHHLRDKVYKAKGRDSGNTITMKTFPGGSLAIIGANSPSDLASKPVRYIFLDEIDRFPLSAGTEGDPIELAERRTETYRHNRRIVKTSTPTIKGKSKIERAYMLGTQEEWRTECPHCRQWSFIRFDDIRFDKEQFADADGEKNWTVSNLRWQCPICKRDTIEHEAKRCPARWFIRNEKALQNGIRSFRLNAFMSPWSDWRAIALQFLKSKDDPELLKVFHNTILGESWELRENSGVPEKLYDRREHYAAEVPPGVLVLTMGIDTQDNRLEYEVVGWSRDEESWGIARGVIPGRADGKEVWAEVDALLDKEWQMTGGRAMRISATFMDSGGHFTDHVYRECARRAAKRIWPIKGEGGESKAYVRPMQKGTGYKGAMGFMIGVDSGKEAILYASGLEEPGSKYMHFPIDQRAGYNLEYFKGLISERQVFHRKQGQTVIAWEKVHERNEPLDCRNYARAAYRFFNWQFDKLERYLNGEQEPEQTPVRHTEEKRAPRAKRLVSRGITV